jgi:hypothetical protein
MSADVLAALQTVCGWLCPLAIVGLVALFGVGTIGQTWAKRKRRRK